MKVVLFCGGLGTRLREHSETIPKPLVPIGNRPIIWHLMRYYAHFGHTEFILCLGFKGDMIKKFFLNYDPYIGCDFVMSKGGAELDPQRTDIYDWNIRFVDTGLKTNIADRLVAVRPYLDDDVFLVNYSDQLSDYPINDAIERFRKRDAVASFIAVRPSQSYHNVHIDDNEDGIVTRVEPFNKANWINGGYMIMRSEIFDYIRPGEELVEEPFGRLIARRRLIADRYEGFWAAMDTLKDKIRYDRMHGRGERPWMVWKDLPRS